MANADVIAALHWRVGTSGHTLYAVNTKGDKDLYVGTFLDPGVAAYVCEMHNTNLETA